MTHPRLPGPWWPGGREKDLSVLRAGLLPLGWGRSLIRCQLRGAMLSSYCRSQDSSVTGVGCTGLHPITCYRSMMRARILVLVAPQTYYPPWCAVQEGMAGLYHHEGSVWSDRGDRYIPVLSSRLQLWNAYFYVHRGGVVSRSGWIVTLMLYYIDTVNGALGSDMMR